MIALVISDLPAARKISGFAAPTSRHLCNLCWLQKSDIREFDTDKWKQHTLEEYCDAATRWRDAETKKEQDRVFKETGIHWSELLRLPYWDPTCFLTIDGMHNLFLGLTQFQFRNLIVIDKQENQTLRRSQAPVYRSADQTQVEKGRQILRGDPMEAVLCRLQVPVLHVLLEEHSALGGLESSRKRPTKKDMACTLLVSHFAVQIIL